MATIQELCRDRQLELLEVDLDPHELPQRLVYALPRVLIWMESTLPTLTTDGYVPGASTPTEQAENLLYQFIVGKPIKSMPPKCMRPEGDGVWELRTHDLRFFGWFWRKSIFVVSAIDTKARCLKGYYHGFRCQAERDRNNLDLDPPKFINGSLDDVL